MQSPSIGSAFANCFMRLSFIFFGRGGNISTSGSRRMLESPGLKFYHSSHFLSTQCFSLCLHSTCKESNGCVADGRLGYLHVLGAWCFLQCNQQSCEVRLLFKSTY